MRQTAKLTRVERQMIAPELAAQDLSNLSSAIIERDSTYWWVELETQYDWNVQSLDFGKVRAQRYGDDTSIGQTATSHPSAPARDNDPLTDDWFTALPQFDFEYLDAYQVSEPQLRAIGTATLDSDGRPFAPFVPWAAVHTEDYVPVTCEALARNNPPYTTNHFGQGQYQPNTPSWDGAKAYLDAAALQRVDHLNKVCKLVKTTDRAGVVRYRGLNFMGMAMLDATLDSALTGPEPLFVRLTRYNADGYPLEIAEQPQHNGPRTRLTYDSANPNPLANSNLLEIVETPGQSHGSALLPAGPQLPTRTTSLTYEPVANQLRSITDAAGARTNVVYEYMESAGAMQDAALQLSIFGIDPVELDSPPWLSHDANGDGIVSYARPLPVAISEPSFESSDGPASVTTFLRYDSYGAPTYRSRAGNTITRTYAPLLDADSYTLRHPPLETWLPPIAAPPKDPSHSGGPLASEHESVDQSVAASFFPGLPNAVTGTTTEYEHLGPLGALSAIFHGDASNSVTLLTYDGHRRVQTTLNPDSLLTYTVYDGVGRVLEHAAGTYGQLSTGKRLFRGADGSLLATCSSALDLTECRHDLDTLLNSRSTGSPSLALQTFERDGESRVVTTTSPEGRVTHTSYHDWGPVESVRVEGPRSSLLTEYTLDVLGQPYEVSQVGASERLTQQLKYDGFGRLIGHLDADGVMTARTYDARDRVVEEETRVASGRRLMTPVRRTALDRDASGRIYQVTEEAASALSNLNAPWTVLESPITYDARGRVECVGNPQGLGERRSYASDGSLSTTDIFDVGPGLSCSGVSGTRLSSEATWSDYAGGVARSASVEYGAAGNRGSQQLTTIDWRWRPNKLLSSLTGPDAVLTPASGGSHDVSEQRAEYDIFGRQSAYDDEWMTRTALTYDKLGRVTLRSENQIAGVSSPADLDISYTYDRAGRLTELVDPQGGTSRFTYDAFGRLQIRKTPGPEKRVAAIHESFSYDDLGRTVLRHDP